jgi:flagellar motor switch protein FliG
VNELGIRKAAVLLMSLPTKSAAGLLGRLPPRMIEQVSLRIAQLDSVSGDEQEKAIQLFMATRTSALASGSGGLERAKDLIREALGKDASEIIEQLQQTLESLPFGFLKHVDPETLNGFINEEHPQTIALLLSYLPAAYGAELLSGVPIEKRLSVIQRLASMGKTNPETISDLERGLELRLSSISGQQMQNVGGVQSVAEILNVSERSVERALMDELSKEDPELMDEIRRRMFVFEDVVKLSDRDVQTLLKNVETSQWAMALKGCSDALREKIMKNMSTRAAENLKEEIGFLGAVRLSDVEAVQQKIVDVIRTLEDSGELSRPTGQEEEEFVK